MPVMDISAIERSAGCRGKNQNTKTRQSGNGRQNNGRFITRQVFFPGFIFLQQAIHDKETVVVSQSENECRQNDIYNIELQSGDSHNPQYPDKCNHHGNKRYQGKFYSAIGKQQHKKYKQ